MEASPAPDTVSCAQHGQAFSLNSQATIEAHGTCWFGHHQSPGQDYSQNGLHRLQGKVRQLRYQVVTQLFALESTWQRVKRLLQPNYNTNLSRCRFNDQLNLSPFQLRLLAC